MKLTPDEIKEAFEHAARHDPLECGGAIVQSKPRARELVCMRNLARVRGRMEWDPLEAQALERSGRLIQALWHTHVRESIEPSDADLLTATKSGFPMIILGYPNGRQTTCWPNPGHELPLMGRRYVYGSIDCYTLIRDYYRQILGIDLPDPPRSEDWWNKGESLYMDSLASGDFEPMPYPETAPRQHDLLLMRMGSKVPNHGAVYIGASRMMHHPRACLSQRVFFAPYYQHRTMYVARHARFRD